MTPRCPARRPYSRLTLSSDRETVLVKYTIPLIIIVPPIVAFSQSNLCAKDTVQCRSGQFRRAGIYLCVQRERPKCGLEFASACLTYRNVGPA